MAHSTQEKTTNPSEHTPPAPARRGDHERLFQLLEEVGPAPEEFMLYLSDPVLERENVFEDEDDR